MNRPKEARWLPDQVLDVIAPKEERAQESLSREVLELLEQNDRELKRAHKIN